MWHLDISEKLKKCSMNFEIFTDKSDETWQQTKQMVD